MKRRFVKLIVCLGVVASSPCFGADKEDWARFFATAEESRTQATKTATENVRLLQRELRIAKLRGDGTAGETAEKLRSTNDRLKGLRDGSILPEVFVDESSEIGAIGTIGGNSTSVYRVISDTGFVLRRMSISREVTNNRGGATRTINKSWHEHFWIEGVSNPGMSRERVHKRGRHTNAINPDSLFEVVGTRTLEFRDGTRKDVPVIRPLADSEVQSQMREHLTLK